MIPEFDQFIGIDWSGAKAKRQKGIQVAVCDTGTAPPALVTPSGAAHWSREEVGELIRGTAGVPTLVGIDFAFAYAHADRQAYFPGFAGSPCDVAALWAFVEAVNGREPDLYGGALYRQPSSPVRNHYWTGGRKPPDFEARRRVTEGVAAGRNATPHPAFKVFSAANVGTGSLAGMRMLHRLQGEVSVWPFTSTGETTVVEIYPKFFVRNAGVKAEKLVEDRDRINAVLTYYASEPYSGPPLDTEDKADAVVSAAALRALARDPEVWSAPDRDPASRLEGWIFGVT